jgi:proteasome lid subunit RPN8/RPN11
MNVDSISAPVFLRYKAYRRIVGYAIRYANNHIDEKDWKEVYGILIGSVEKNKKVIIKDAVPVCIGLRTGVELEPIHYVDLSQIDASLYERFIENETTDFFIGWWHSHPGLGFFFSEIDCKTHLGYQDKNPYAIGLVFDHTKMSSNSLGLAALRLDNPEKGMFSKYIIVELKYKEKTEVINQKIKKLRGAIQNNIKLVLKELDYIDNILIRRELINLQKNYGLLLVSKDNNLDMKNQDKIEIQDENKQYIGQLEDYKKSYKIPRFREVIEEELLMYSTILKHLLERGNTIKFEKKSTKYKKKLRKRLEKPNQWYKRLMNDFTKRIEIINPYNDYLDTNERKIIEIFKETITEYYNILNNLNIKAELN